MSHVSVFVKQREYHCYSKTISVYYRVKSDHIHMKTVETSVAILSNYLEMIMRAIFNSVSKCPSFLRLALRQLWLRVAEKYKDTEHAVSPIPIPCTWGPTPIPCYCVLWVPFQFHVLCTSRSHSSMTVSNYTTVFQSMLITINSPVCF